MPESTIERTIVIGMIVSTDYLSRISRVWNSKLLRSDAAFLIGDWCVEYFNEYNKAPNHTITEIYNEKKRRGLNKSLVDEIGEDILPFLSKEFDRAGVFNVDYVLDRTEEYFKQRALDEHKVRVDALIAEGNPAEAEKVMNRYRPFSLFECSHGTRLGSKDSQESVKKLFDTTQRTVTGYEGVLGELLNAQMVREGFVAFLAPEKRGKSYMLMDLALRAVRYPYYSNVAFFQAGDMSESVQWGRIASYLSVRPFGSKESIMMPVRDCFKNQSNECNRRERLGHKGLGMNEWSDVSFDRLKSALHDPKLADYKPCRECDLHRTNGSIFYKVQEVEPLTRESSANVLAKFDESIRSRFQLSTHTNGTLTVEQMRTILNDWERFEGFIPDLIVVDYADLLVHSDNSDFRHQVDLVWRDLRALAQDYHCLVVTATQADAKSYGQRRLNLSNFSEDKRKYSHVTAMYGLNWDPHGNEAKMGLLRINELLCRHGSLAQSDVYVIQQRAVNQVMLGSFTVTGKGPRYDG